MGASLLGLYLINASEEAGQLLDGSILYGTPWDYAAGWNYLYYSYWGIPSWFVAWNLRRITISKYLP